MCLLHFFYHLPQHFSHSSCHLVPPTFFSTAVFLCWLLLDVPMQEGVSSHFSPDWLACLAHTRQIFFTSLVQYRVQMTSSAENAFQSERPSPQIPAVAHVGSDVPACNPAAATCSCKPSSSCTRQNPSASSLNTGIRCNTEALLRRGKKGSATTQRNVVTRRARLNLRLNPSDFTSRE